MNSHHPVESSDRMSVTHLKTKRHISKGRGDTRVSTRTELLSDDGSKKEGSMEGESSCEEGGGREGI